MERTRNGWLPKDMPNILIPGNCEYPPLFVKRVLCRYNLSPNIFPGGASLVAQHVQNPPAMQVVQEMQVLSRGWEDPLEEGMATHSSILAWRIPWKEESGGLQSVGSQRVRHKWSDLACTHIFPGKAKEDELKQTNSSTGEIRVEISGL